MAWYQYLKDVNFNTIYFEKSELVSIIKLCEKYEFLMGDNYQENIEENIEMKKMQKHAENSQ